jgi:hypothetical protein
VGDLLALLSVGQHQSEFVLIHLLFMAVTLTCARAVSRVQLRAGAAS